MTKPISNAERMRESARRTANGVFQAWEDRTNLVKTLAAEERAATDAKTAKLRALRLAKEAEDAATAAAEAAANPAPEKKKSVRRVTAS